MEEKLFNVKLTSCEIFNSCFVNIDFIEKFDQDTLVELTKEDYRFFFAIRRESNTRDLPCGRQTRWFGFAICEKSNS
jgi:hypothetical protein